MFSVHCCGFTERVIRLVISAVLELAAVAIVIYDIRSRGAEQLSEEKTYECRQNFVILKILNTQKTFLYDNTYKVLQSYYFYHQTNVVVVLLSF